MNRVNGEERNSMLLGPSLQNQRRERLWRDVYTNALDKYYKVFRHMENHHVLDIQNSIHIYSLQYTFLLRIERALSNWTKAHNSHGVRTEHRLTPLKLWYGGSIQNSDKNMTAMNNCLGVILAKLKN